MPGAACNALNTIQSIMGVDLHKQIPPPPPVGPLPAPHVIAAITGMAMAATTKQAPTVMAGGGFALARQHDLGIGLYHFAPNALLPIVCMAGGNKAEFGSATVQVPTGRMAAAVIPLAGINLQLDCNEPAPMPTSTLDASLNTVYVGMTIADVFAGFVAMAADSAWVFLAGKVTGATKRMALFGLMEGVALLGPEALLVAGLSWVAAGPVTELISEGVDVLLGYCIGSPLGYSFGPDWMPWTGWGTKVNDEIAELISPSPAPTLPSVAPAPAPAPGGLPPSLPPPSSHEDSPASPTAAPSSSTPEPPPLWTPGNVEPTPSGSTPDDER